MWSYNGKSVTSIRDTPKGAVGFIYNIIDKTNDKGYIGRKSFKSITNRTVSKAVYEKAKKAGEKVSRKKNKKLSTKEKTVYNHRIEKVTETNWLIYNGSSKGKDGLLEAIKKGASIERHIIQYCYNKKQMTYYETKWQMCEGVIEENKDKYYNGNISGKFFEKDLK